jgi:KipI family sensor histidine kinase inhibitor
MRDAADTSPHVRIDRMGDDALLITLDDVVDLDANRRAHRIAAAVATSRRSIPGLGVATPGHASVLVPFDPDRCDEDSLRSTLEDIVAAGVTPGPSSEGALHEITVRYGGADGADLPEVAARTGLSEAEVVRLHAGVEYAVLVLGFVPGFPYLGVVPASLDLPRRATPRVRVPAGSVAIAGRQTGIYPFETPGGWHLIGRTEAPLWDAAREPPSLLAPGDRVRFVPG